MLSIKQDTLIRCLIFLKCMNIFKHNFRKERDALSVLCLTLPLDLFHISFLKGFIVHDIFKRKYRGKMFIK